MKEPLPFLYIPYCLYRHLRLSTHTSFSSNAGVFLPGGQSRLLMSGLRSYTTWPRIWNSVELKLRHDWRHWLVGAKRQHYRKWTSACSDSSIGRHTLINMAGLCRWEWMWPTRNMCLWMDIPVLQCFYCWLLIWNGGTTQTVFTVTKLCPPFRNSIGKSDWSMKFYHIFIWPRVLVSFSCVLFSLFGRQLRVGMGAIDWRGKVEFGK